MLPIKHQNDVSDFVLVFLLLTLNIFYTFFSDFIVDFEQVNVSRVRYSGCEIAMTILYSQYITRVLK